jgi:alpha-beta hydrolase superfamily lysophospholipase
LSGELRRAAQKFVDVEAADEREPKGITMRLTMLSIAAGLAFAGLAAAQDYGREKRWADEIVPGLVVGDAVYVQQTRGKDPQHKFLALWAPVPNAKTAIVLVHGVGVHPDHGIIGALRVKLNDAGYSTLAIQMPVQASDAKLEDYYPAVFAEAAERIAASARWLQANGPRQIVLLSHSMGAWMANEYLINADETPFAAWVCMGITGRITSPSSIRLPTLDLYGENDLDVAKRAAPLRRLMQIVMPSGTEQQMIPGADHYYNAKENEAAAAIAQFLKKRGL